MTSNFSQLSTDALSPGQLPESVKALLKRAHINRYPKRTTIVDAGTESKSLYLILKGSVSIILREDDEREIVVAYLNPGDFFGEMGLFEPNPQRTAEVRTRDVCEIAEISYDNFHELSKQYPDLSYAVFAQLVRRLKNTTRKMTDLGVRPYCALLNRPIFTTRSNDLAEWPSNSYYSTRDWTHCRVFTRNGWPCIKDLRRSRYDSN